MGSKTRTSLCSKTGSHVFVARCCTMQRKIHVFVYRSFGQFCLSNNYALRLLAVLPVAKIMTVSKDNANIHSIM